MIKTIIPVWICWAILTFVPFGEKPLMAQTLTRLTVGDAGYMIRWSVYWLAPIGAILGHCYPCFANFKGGKGVSNFMGTAVCTSWMCGFIPGLLYFAILKWKKYVSLASILTPCIISLVFWTWSILCLTVPEIRQIGYLAGYGPTLAIDWVASIVVSIMTVFVIVRHSGNIQRIKDGTERKIKWMK
jgi:glycerol-3-phosphate acyltransferase PlsY